MRPGTERFAHPVDPWASGRRWPSEVWTGNTARASCPWMFVAHVILLPVGIILLTFAHKWTQLFPRILLYMTKWGLLDLGLLVGVASLGPGTCRPTRAISWEPSRLRDPPWDFLWLFKLVDFVEVPLVDAMLLTLVLLLFRLVLPFIDRSPKVHPRGPAGLPLRRQLPRRLLHPHDGWGGIDPRVPRLPPVRWRSASYSSWPPMRSPSGSSTCGIPPERVGPAGGAPPHLPHPDPPCPPTHPTRPGSDPTRACARRGPGEHFGGSRGGERPVARLRSEGRESVGFSPGPPFDSRPRRGRVPAGLHPPARSGGRLRPESRSGSASRSCSSWPPSS